MIARISFVCLVAAIFFVFSSTFTVAKDYTVSPEQWPTAINENAKPGDRFLLLPGVYKIGKPIENVNGTQTDPIVITCSDPMDLPQFSQGNFEIRNCSHFQLDRICFDASKPSLISISGTLGRERLVSTGIVLRSVNLNGGIAVSYIDSISIENCRILRDTGWRWGRQIVMMSGVNHVAFRDNRIESRGMHTFLVRVSNYVRLEISRCKFQGSFQQAISLEQDDSEKNAVLPRDTMSESALIYTNIFLGGDFALSTLGDQKINIRRNSFLGQKRGLLLSTESFNGTKIPPTPVVLAENLVNHSYLEIREVIANKGALQPAIDSINSKGNIWFCRDRIRLNPDRLGLWMFRDSIFGVRPSTNLVIGEGFLDDLEYNRLGYDFQRRGLLGWCSFGIYLFVLLGMASLILSNVWRNSHGSARKTFARSSTNLDAYQGTARPWSWIAGVFLAIYAGVRFAPFKVSQKNLFTIENLHTYRSSFVAEDNWNYLLFMSFLAGISTYLFALSPAFDRLAKFSEKVISARLIVRSILQNVFRVILVAGFMLAVDWIDFYHFGGFDPPSDRRTFAILFGAFFGAIGGLLVPRAFLSVLDTFRSDYERIRWIDLAALFGFFFFLLYAWYPFEVSVAPRAMLEKLNGETVSLMPFANGFDVPSMLIQIWRGLLVGIGSSRFFQNNRHAARKTIAWSLLVLLFVEASKLVLPMKPIATDHVLYGLLGAVLSTYGVPIWKSTSCLLDFARKQSGSGRWQRWICEPSWVLLPVWIECGWFYFWQITVLPHLVLPHLNVEF